MEIVSPVTKPNTPFYVFVDESGDLLPKGLGSDHLVLSAFVTKSPSLASTVISELRYRLLSEGFNIENFHATDDSRLVRIEFFKQLTKIGYSLGISTGIEKERHATSQELTGLYIELLEGVLEEVVRINNSQAPITLLIDSTLDKRCRSEAKRKLKHVLLASKLRNFIYFQSMKRDFCGQIADYIAWSTFQKLERKNDSYFLQIEENLELKVVDLDDPPG
jgi:hypothetical protein